MPAGKPIDIIAAFNSYPKPTLVTQKAKKKKKNSTTQKAKKKKNSTLIIGITHKRSKNKAFQKMASNFDQDLVSLKRSKTELQKI